MSSHSARWNKNHSKITLDSSLPSLALLPPLHFLPPAYVLTPNSPSSVLIFGYSSLPYCVPPRRSTTVPFRTAVKRTVMLHLLMFIIIVHCHSDLYSIRRMQFTYQTFVSWRSLHRRFQLSLELSFVSYLLGKTKVEKIRICENYIFFYFQDVMNVCEWLKR